MRGRLIGATVFITLVGVTTHKLMEWKSIEAYGDAENTDVAKLVNALDTANNDAEVKAVIDAHAAQLEAKNAATDAELKNQGGQVFLEQQLKKQRITTDIKQQIKRTQKAVTEACG